MAEVSQADTRAWGEFTDQHGRLWGANTENKTRHPCGPFRPQFKAPFYPDQKYIEVKGTNRVRISYRRWLDELDEADALYDQTVRNYAVHLYGEKAPAAIKNPPAELLDITGPRPGLVPREFIEACVADNQWILGFNPKMPKWAEPLVEKVAEKKAPRPIGDYPDEPLDVEEERDVA